MRQQKDLLKPYGRALLKVMTTGNQLSADMLQPDFFPDWGPKMLDNMGNLRAKRMAIPFDVGKSVKNSLGSFSPNSCRRVSNLGEDRYL